MPYIRPVAREYFTKLLNELHRVSIADAGELNYLVSELINQYHATHQKNYQTMNDIAGALEGAKLEYVRRIVGPYENVKIEMNGDVYTEETLK